MKNKSLVLPLIAIAFLFILSSGCKKGSPAILTTTSMSAVCYITATSGGVISSDGGTAITARGVCWSKGTTPTIDDSKTSDGTGTGSFTSAITGLTINTTYSVRAYATNGAGTTYGDVFTFSTAPLTFTDVEGNMYHTVLIGSQIWMVENLKTVKYRNGDAVPNVTVGQTWALAPSGSYCDYNNDVSNSAIYGRIYNWKTVNDSRKIAPAGWHVPSDDEWTTLTTFLLGESVASGKIKEAGTSHWATPNTGATNSSGFTALPAGGRGYDGVFDGIGMYAGFMSSTELDGLNSWRRTIAYSDAVVYRNYTSKISGFSVRCVRD